MRVVDENGIPYELWEDDDYRYLERSDGKVFKTAIERRMWTSEDGDVSLVKIGKRYKLCVTGFCSVSIPLSEEDLTRLKGALD